MRHGRVWYALRDLEEYAPWKSMCVYVYVCEEYAPWKSMCVYVYVCEEYAPWEEYGMRSVTWKTMRSRACNALTHAPGGDPGSVSPLPLALTPVARIPARGRQCRLACVYLYGLGTINKAHSNTRYISITLNNLQRFRAAMQRRHEVRGRRHGTTYSGPEVRTCQLFAFKNVYLYPSSHHTKSDKQYI